MNHLAASNFFLTKSFASCGTFLPFGFSAGDAAATAANIVGHHTLYRLAFTIFMLEMVAQAVVSAMFYDLLKPVNRNLALLSAFFGIGSMVLFAVAQASFYSATLAVGESAGMAAFSPDQRNAIAMLAVRISYTIAGLFLILYGIATMLRGYLIARSGYLPKLIGILFMIGGAGFALRTTTLLLAPAWSSTLMLIPIALGGIPLMLWLLIKGVRPPLRT